MPMDDTAPQEPQADLPAAVELSFGERLLQAAQAVAPGATLREKSDRPAIVVKPEQLLSLCQWLRDDPALGFDMLYDHTAIDWPAEQRIELVYTLAALSGLTPVRSPQLVYVVTSVARDNPLVPTVMDIWPIAEWQEREVYDLFGVLYDGHPDLRRLFLEDDWVGFPLRKDYEDDFMLEPPT
jgi:NADH-quinone oxidoreductase subunit C